MYPRTCGGTYSGSSTSSSDTGVSPRLRGNRRFLQAFPLLAGCIPALAGEPRWPQGRQSCWRVYPRACGETRSSSRHRMAWTGVSPRLRGNQGLQERIGLVVGCIPAPAGKPARGRAGQVADWVYPRACGGTLDSLNEEQASAGVSPRLRGNPSTISWVMTVLGCIPAPAGEPYRPVLPFCQTRVYPRACGGTSYVDNSQNNLSGVSPRLRGNRLLG
ncbi:hypothetical protein FBZ92_101320 [Nitrospirillum viridazoti]|uniref:Uncharacterized protein n=1 Tax=Nitrospirillum amazonense TaxID=28077 RepID=A0A560J5B1_9PROT|nr:hypothetical protein FBZ92_101320 [Nitrospirillum amazonense]